MLGYETLGTGDRRVIVLNDWLCDTSTWDDARRYLDVARFTWAFVDLRGYGRSRGLGDLDRVGVDQASCDVTAVADALGWRTHAIVGHSMSTLVALHVAQRAPERVERIALLTPPPPTGMGADDATLARLTDLALGDDTARLGVMSAMNAGRLCDAWVRFKVARWRATSDARAVAGYVPMFARDGLPDRDTTIDVPVLAVTGQRDAEVMRRDAVRAALSPVCRSLSVAALEDCGHYPMQEAPPPLVSLLERFLSAS